MGKQNLYLLTLLFLYELAFFLFVMAPSAPTICHISVYGSTMLSLDFIHGLAGKSDSVLEFDHDRIYFLVWLPKLR